MKIVYAYDEVFIEKVIHMFDNGWLYLAHHEREKVQLDNGKTQIELWKNWFSKNEIIDTPTIESGFYKCENKWAVTYGTEVFMGDFKQCLDYCYQNKLLNRIANKIIVEDQNIGIRKEEKIMLVGELLK